MNENTNDQPLQNAAKLVERGFELKKAGQPDAALTEFRRAILADPNCFEAHFETGLLIKQKVDSNPIFLQKSFEAFKKAAALNPTHQGAHDNYITMAHKMGQLEFLLEEYKNLAAAHPDNPLFERCRKNIITLSMAAMPDQVKLGGGDGGVKIRRFIFFLSIGILVLGFLLLLGPPIFKKAGQSITPEQVKNFAKLGLGCFGAAVLGFFIRAKI